MESTVSNAKFILASASPRRRELLHFLGVSFAVLPAQGEENALGTGKERVRLLARQKGDEVFALGYGKPVLSADTLVCVDQEILGKPTDECDARRMLRLLSGRWHEVHTGVCLLTSQGEALEQVVTTRVRFAALTDADVRWYLSTGEPMDKAGAYGVQGAGGALVTEIEGSPSNVVGLPMHTVLTLLRQAKIIE